jgi:glycosyltransferase involved in cell wall biosynthesis
VAIAGTRSPIVFTPVGFPTRQLVGWLRAAMGCRDIHVTCPSDTARRFLVTRGVPIERTHLVRPGVDLKNIPTGRNERLRAELGYSTTDTVLYCPLEMTRAADHSTAVWAISILNIIRPEFRLLLWGNGKNLSNMKEVLGRTIDRATFRIVEIDSPDPLFAAADGVLLTPLENVPMVSIAGAMASGKPIVSTFTESICELLEDRHTALLVAERTPRAIAHRVIDMFADPTLAWKLQDRARAEVYDHLTQAKMLELFRQVYASVSGSASETDSPILTKPIEA